MTMFNVEKVAMKDLPFAKNVYYFDLITEKIIIGQRDYIRHP